MSVAQLVERRVVAAEVVESYSIRHPICPGSSVGSSRGLKILVSVVQVHSGAPTAEKQHSLHKMHGDV